MKRQMIFGFIGAFAVGSSLSLSTLAEPRVRQEINAGVQQKDVNSPEAKFEEYKEVPNGIILEHYGLKSEGESIDLELNINNARQDDQSADVVIDAAKIQVSGSWDQIPHLISKESKTLYIDDGNGNLILADPIQSDLQTGGNSGFITNFSSFAAGAHIQELKTITRKGSLAMGYRFSDALKLDLSASEETKKGTKAQGMRIDLDYTEFARPVDYKTYNSNVELGFAGKDVQWGFLYNFSSFKDQLDSLTVDNLIRATGNATNSTTGRISLEPDNHAHSVSFNGGINLPVHSRLTTMASFNYMRQNEGLLPYSANPFLTTDYLPSERANAKSINWVQDYNLTTKPVQNFDFGLRFHSDQLNNETSELVFPGVLETESVFDNTPVTNKPFSFRKDSLAGSAGWRVAEPVRVNVKYGTEWVNRDDREIDKSQENSLNLSADYKPCVIALVRASYLNARRRMDDIEPAHIFAPNARLADISDRDRNQGDISIQMNPGKTNITLNGGLGYDKYLPGKGDLQNGNTNYINQMFGLVNTRFAKAGIDVDHDFSEKVGFYTYYQYQIDKSAYNLTSSLTNQAGIYSRREDVRYDVGGVGIRISAIKEIVDINLGYDIVRSRGNTDFTELRSSNATKINPPETTTTTQDFSVKGNVRASDNLSFGLEYLFEKYDVFDWATDGLGLISPTQRNVFLGDASHDYKAHVVTAKVNYRFLK